MSDDGWREAAPFYDLLDDAERPRRLLRTLRPWIAAASRGVLDVGAGTGTLGIAVAEAYPGLPALMAEPSPGMRGALLTKLAERRHLWDRVTVLVDEAGRVDPGHPVDLALCIAVLWALDPGGRAAALAALARAVQPGGVLVVGGPPYRDRPATCASRSRRELELGEGTVELEFAAHPDGATRTDGTAPSTGSRSASAVRRGGRPAGRPPCGPRPARRSSTSSPPPASSWRPRPTACWCCAAGPRSPAAYAGSWAAWPSFR
jgi:SAM-dependent methyltransferase